MASYNGANPGASRPYANDQRTSPRPPHAQASGIPQVHQPTAAVYGAHYNMAGAPQGYPQSVIGAGNGLPNYGFAGQGGFAGNQGEKQCSDPRLPNQPMPDFSGVASEKPYPSLFAIRLYLHRNSRHLSLCSTEPLRHTSGQLTGSDPGRRYCCPGPEPPRSAPASRNVSGTAATSSTAAASNAATVQSHAAAPAAPAA